MEIVLQRGRNVEWTLTVKDASGAVVAFTSEDTMRVKIGRAGSEPLLDLDSTAATESGTTVSDANPTTVGFVAADVTRLPAGTYDLEVGIYESNDQKLRAAVYGVCHVLDSMLGEVGAT